MPLGVRRKQTPGGVERGFFTDTRQYIQERAAFWFVMQWLRGGEQTCAGMLGQVFEQTQTPTVLAIEGEARSQPHLAAGLAYRAEAGVQIVVCCRACA